MNKNQQTIQQHLVNISLEITKIDDMVISTENIPSERLIKHRERRVKLQETSDYLKYLLHVESAKIEEQSKIITMQ